jgi:hypothetical protein
MNRFSTVLEVTSALRFAARRGLAVALVFALCAALAGMPARAAQLGANRDEGPARGAAGPRLPTEPRFGVKIAAATPDGGIEGEVRGAGTFIRFVSRQSDDGLRATITAPDGTVLYDYSEFDEDETQILVEGGAVLELSRTPELRVKGLLYGSSTPEQLEVLRSLATSREGRLIRLLGLELFSAAPGTELVEERRGLELATQALWPHFSPGGSAAPPLTSDYEVTPDGYLVLTQPEDLVLAINRTARPHLREKHNDSRVNGCFGRCGSECTGGILGVQIYASHWQDTQGSQFTYSQEMRCINGEDWLYTTYATPTTHRVNGWWTPGCQLHDNCCRLNPLLCWTVCMAVVPVTVLDLLFDPLGEVRAWTYSDYSWGSRSDYLGYSGCTCPDAPPFAIIWDCAQ